MLAPRRTSLWALVPLLVLGCGGSGSSGFDVTSENAAIARAIAQGRCVGSGELTVCPSGVAPTAPSPSGRPQVEIDLPADGVVDCAPLAGGAACSVAVTIATQGLSAGAQLRVAERDASGGSDWTVGDALEPLPELSTTVTVALGGGAAGSSGEPFQIAVLVFAAPIASPPAQVRELGATGADLAFVSGQLRAQPSP